jgi:N-acylneuraminate cytidylyltransferase
MSGIFDRVVVSTEDTPIARVARRAGIQVDIRPKHLATDRARVVDVTLHYLDKMKEEGGEPDSICVAYSTAALVRPDDFQKGWDQFKKTNANCLMCVAPFDAPPAWALQRGEGDFLKPSFPQLLKERQALPEYFADLGYFYFIKTAVLRKYREFHVPRLAGYRMSRLRAIDVNDPDDLVLLRLLYPWLKKQRA